MSIFGQHIARDYSARVRRAGTMSARNYGILALGPMPAKVEAPKRTIYPRDVAQLTDVCRIWQEGDADRMGLRCDTATAGDYMRSQSVVFTADDGMTCTAMVWRLPRSRGWLAGYYEDMGDCCTLYHHVYDTEDDAAKSAREEAEQAVKTRNADDAAWQEANTLGRIAGEAGEPEESDPYTDGWLSDVWREAWQEGHARLSERAALVSPPAAKLVTLRITLQDGTIAYVESDQPERVRVLVYDMNEADAGPHAMVVEAAERATLELPPADAEEHVCDDCRSNGPAADCDCAELNND